MCLREVDKSNVFVGMYGERYGWCKSQGGMSAEDKLISRALETASKEFPWISEFSDRSITEIEMRMVGPPLPSDVTIMMVDSQFR